MQQHANTRLWMALIPLLLITACSGSGSLSTGNDPSPPPSTGPFTVQSTSPSAGAASVSVYASVSIVLSNNIDPTSIQPGVLNLSPAVAGNVTAQGNSLLFTATSALATGTQYTVTVASGVAGVHDQNGQTLAASHVFSFTTTSVQPTDCAATTVLCVDDTAGPTQEFSTLQAAADAAQPGDTVLVHPGQYAGFQVTRSGTAQAPIVFSAQGSGVIINRDGPTGDGIRLQNVNYITLNGFTIQNPTTHCIAARGATATAPMTGNIVQNNVCSGAGGQCFYLSQFSNGVVENNTISSCGQGGGTRNHGIYLANAGSDNTVIRGNNIAGGASGGESNGIHMNGDLSVGGDGLIQGVTIENNIIYNNVQNGINMDGAQDILIRNNLIYGNGRNAVRGYQQDGAAGARNMRIVNNTLRAETSGWAIKLSEDQGGHVVFNNILLGTSGSLSVGHASFSSNNNAGDDRYSSDNDTTTVSLAQWRTNTGQDLSSLVATPDALFVNAASSNYHLKTSPVSPAVNAGRSSLNSVNAPTSDLEGSARPQGAAHDIGAYEAAP